MTDCELEPIDGTACVNAGLGYSPLGAASRPYASADGDDPSAPCAEIAAMAPAWRMISDLLGGTADMRAAGDLHLPQFPHECSRAYEIRRRTAVLFPAFSRTVNILVGKPFSKPITVGDDVPPRIRTMLDDVDREGRNLDSFAAAVARDAMAYGISGVLVDCPPSNAARTVEEERAAGIRPYLVHVKHDAILGWRVERGGGSAMLSQLRLLETVEEPKGAFGVECVRQVRVLTPGRWQTWRQVEDEKGRATWRVHDEGDTSIGVVPFVPVYGYRKDFMVGVPPMLDLAFLNVQHWQSGSDQQTILSTARVPILFAKGMRKQDKYAIGAGAMIEADDPAADIKFVEHSGSAIEAGRLAILDLEDQMRQTGAELLVIKPGNTTEVQTRSDNEPAMCDLQRIMQSLEDAFDLALYYMATFLKEPAGGHVNIYSDFGVATLAEASAQLLATMQADGALSHATLLSELKRRGVLGPDVDVAAEVAAARGEHSAALADAARRERAMLDLSMADAADQEMADGIAAAQSLRTTASADTGRAN